MPTAGRVLLTASLAALVAVSPAAAASPAPTISEFPIATPDTQPAGIAGFPNGTLVFGQGAGDEFGLSTLGGATSEISSLGGATAGVAIADGHYWLTEPGANRIARADNGGRFSEIPLPEPGSQPTGITAGPGGTVWFTEAGGTARIGELSAAGTLSHEYTAGLTADSHPTSIVEGPDGNLWFTESAGPGRIGEINPATGVISEYPTPTPGSQPTSIAVGPDGNLWFTERADPGRIGEINPATHAITEYPTPTPGSHPTSITAGPGGDLWFTEAANPGAIGWITPQGVISEMSTPTQNSQPNGITEGSDGNVWFTELGGHGQLGRLTLPLPILATGVVTSVGRTTATLTGTINPNGFDTTYHFDWGIGPNDGARLPGADADAGSGDLQGPVAEVLSGLAPGTTYHYRLVATNCGGCVAGTSDGADMTFTTAPAVAPAVGQTPTFPNVPAAAGAPPVTPPVMGHSAVTSVVSGRVLVKVRGSGRLRPLTAGKTIPLGSLVDARRGRLRVTTEITRHGRMETAEVWGGDFVIGQTGTRGLTTFRIPSHLSACPAPATGAHGNVIRAVSAAGSRSWTRPRSRGRRTFSLWARDNHGRYSTRGHNSVATVRGTVWKTVESCRGTLTFVRKGVVSVRDLHTHRSVLVHAGHSFLARP